MTEVYWLEQNENDLLDNDAWLSGKEKARLAGMRFAKRRADWKLGRWTAKLAVANVLNLAEDVASLQKIEIQPAASGAPEVLVDRRRAPVSISLSHRSARAVCAVAASVATLGCDLELIEPRSDVFLTDYFTAEEQQFIAQAPAPHHSAILALLWSAKESALKALGAGLRSDTRRVIVRLEAAQCTGRHHRIEVWHPLRVRYEEGGVFEGWWRWTNDFVYTTVAEPAPSAPFALPRSHAAQCLQSHRSEARPGIFAEGEIPSSVLSTELAVHNAP